jgi:murein DD-endopeptidase MepM/ murein hydrolase activator NlpD
MKFLYKRLFIGAFIYFCFFPGIFAADLSLARLKYDVSQLNSGIGISTESQAGKSGEVEQRQDSSSSDSIFENLIKLAGKKEQKVIKQILDLDKKVNFINVKSIEKKLGKVNVPALVNLFNGVKNLKIKGFDLSQINELKGSLSQIENLIKQYKNSPKEVGKLSFFAGLAKEQLGNVEANPVAKSSFRASAIQSYKNSMANLKKLPDQPSQDASKDAEERIESLQNPFGEVIPLTGKKGPKKVLLTSDYGTRIHPVKKTKRFHAGVDLAGWKCKGWKVVAIGPGRVIKSGWETGYGYLVVLSHEVDGKQYFSKYAHLKKSGRIATGKVVKPGQLLGYCNNSGISTGSHLHFEVRKDASRGETLDPKDYLPEVEPIPGLK